MIKSTLDSDQS